MAIRRFRKHVARQDWFAVGIDVVIVVVGVFLGIQASNWNASRIETNLAHSYRDRLIEEVTFNVRQHRQQSAYYRQVLDHGLAAMAAHQSDRIDDPAKFVIDSLQLTQIDRSPAKTFIYNEMMSAGLVSRLGDEKVQEAASDYYAQVSANDRVLLDVYPYRDKIRGILSYAIQAEIQVRCGDRPVYLGNQIIGVRLADKCSAQFARPEASAAAALIRQEPGIERDMVRYLNNVHERLGSLESTVDRGMRLLKALQSAAAKG